MGKKAVEDRARYSLGSSPSMIALTAQPNHPPNSPVHQDTATSTKHTASSGPGSFRAHGTKITSRKWISHRLPRAEPVPCRGCGAAPREAPPAAPCRAVPFPGASSGTRQGRAGQGSLGRCPAAGAVPRLSPSSAELPRARPARPGPAAARGSGGPGSPAAARPTLTARDEWQWTWWDTVAVWFMLPAAPGGLGEPAGPSRRLRAAGGLRLRLRLRCSAAPHPAAPLLRTPRLRPPAPPRPAPPRPPDRLRTGTRPGHSGAAARGSPAGHPRGWGAERAQPRSVKAEPRSALSRDEYDCSRKFMLAALPFRLHRVFFFPFYLPRSLLPPPPSVPKRLQPTAVPG